MNAIKIANTVILTTLATTVLTGLAVFFQPWTVGRLPSLQPTSDALMELLNAAVAQFEAHRVVGETTGWYGPAILLSSMTVGLAVNRLLRAAGITPQNLGGVIRHTVGITTLTVATAVATAMLFPLLIDAPSVADTPPMEHHLANAAGSAWTLTRETATLATTQWNWWIWSGLMAALNLPAIILTALSIRRAKLDAEGVYLYMVQV